MLLGLIYRRNTAYFMELYKLHNTIGYIDNNYANNFKD